MTQAPHVLRGARSGFRLGEGKLEDSLMVSLLDTHCGLYMAQTSDKLAQQAGVTRAEMDAYALRSQQAAAAAQARGVFKDEIAPITVTAGVADAVMGLRSKEVTVSVDEGLRPGTTVDSIKNIRPAIPGGE